ncbi:hypothetical protein [Algibacter mikhailovii]|uniref:Uncharacterized protein n=1 Tax=Algibacter mikhailovii TaxID=425498 RepID=A0A918V6V5_9FLAO|nr:hypothetical protein [Algibacter mikhailovii]GGZ70855.1 hypothetical protein GCM10007028_05080 [Algibacter mikhailovii]
MNKKYKKILKICAGVIVFFTLPSLLLFGFLYFKYNQELPEGISGKEADALAVQMLDALNYDAYKNTKHISWTFKKRRHYELDKERNICKVFWKGNKVILDLTHTGNSKVYIHGFKNESALADELISKALNYYNNDSFWLLAPYKVFDQGTTRQLVKIAGNKDALLVTYTSGGSTPGDSYLWILDEKHKPIAFRMWTSILPIDGIEASWSNWTTTDSGAQLPTFHKLFFIGLEITDIKGTE